MGGFGSSVLEEESAGCAQGREEQPHSASTLSRTHQGRSQLSLHLFTPSPKKDNLLYENLCLLWFWKYLSFLP